MQGGNEMRKILILLACVLLCSNVAFASPVVYEKPDVKILVEGEALQLDAEVPIIVNSRTLVPLRKLLVGLGVPDNNENIKWIGETREVKVIYNGVTIDLAIDSTKGYINGREYKLDAAPIIHRDRTYLPARFVGEALGYTISWDQYTPAVIVTSNENMNKLTEILNDLNTAMNKVKSYEVITVREADIASNYEGELENIEYTIKNIERADLNKKIIYTENSYTDQFEDTITFSYNTPNAFYSCGKYVEDGILYNEGWEVYNYDPELDEKNPFDEKEKLGLMNFDKSLYGSLVLKEYNNAYTVSTISNQLDVLKALNGEELYNEIYEYGDVKDFSFELAINKETKMPINLKVNFTMSTKALPEEMGYNFSTVETTEYIMNFMKYNENMELDLSEVDL